MFLVRRTAGRDPTSCIRMIPVINGSIITHNALLSLPPPCPLFPLSTSLVHSPPPLRLMTFSTPRVKCLYFVRKLQFGLTLPFSAPSTSTGSAMTNQERPSPQAKYEHEKLHSSVLRYNTMYNVPDVIHVISVPRFSPLFRVLY